MRNSKNKLYAQTPNIKFWILLVLSSIAPISLGKLGLDLYLTPQIEICITFFASIYFSVILWQLFLYGLFIDVLYGQPIGVTSLILLLLANVISRFKGNLSKQGLRPILIYFTYAIISTNLLRHIIFSIYYSSRIVPYYSEILINLLVNIIFYIFLHMVLYNKVYSKHYDN